MSNKSFSPVWSSQTPVIQIKDTNDLLKTYGVPVDSSNYTYNWRFETPWGGINRVPDITITNQLDSSTVIKIEMPNGSLESITKADLVKYLSERKLVQENELVRKMHERYQVALKLARSDDDGNTGA